jgi:hypothetical protein
MDTPARDNWCSQKWTISVENIYRRMEMNAEGFVKWKLDAEGEGPIETSTCLTLSTTMSNDDMISK